MMVGGSAKSEMIDIKGVRFSRLLVVCRDGVTSDGRAKWSCACDCGNTKSISGRDLRRGLTMSCGCLRSENIRNRSITHGMTGSSTYHSWVGMKHRCYNKNQEAYKNYGALGVIVCDEWLDGFENFLRDMGERPEGMTLDRENPLGNYTPDNCRWASPALQAQNTRGRRAIEIMDKLSSFEISLNEAIKLWTPKK